MANEKNGRGTRVPDPFPISKSMMAWFLEKIGTVPLSVILEEHESFVDYWRGRAGAMASKADWPATWRNWMRRAAHVRYSALGRYLFAHPNYAVKILARQLADEQIAAMNRSRYERLN